MDNQRILQAGDLVQWYRIEEVLGRGGFGVTYLATDTNLDHKVAIKEYMPGWSAQRLEDNTVAALNDTVQEDFDLGVSNFLREARTLVKFRHPNIVRVMAVFEANNTAYLVMEYEEGQEFKTYVQNDDSLDEGLLKSLILRIVDGLDQVHQYGFLHRDIKPVNLIIRNDGSPVLLDFGAARPTDAEAGGHTAFVSAGYTPIEQYQEGEGMEVGPWTDIYSLGATLYYAISGRTPVGPTGRLAALVQKSPDPLEAARLVGSGRYSEKFLQAIDWALNFRPSDRPQNLSEWREAIEFEEPQAPIEVYETVHLRSRARDSRRPSSRRRPGEKRAAEKQQAPGALVAKGLFSVAIILVLVVAGVFAYRTVAEKNELNELITQAHNRFDRGDYLEGVPLYREVLTVDPGNTAATNRLTDIQAIYSEQFNAALTAGDLDRADNTLDALESATRDDDAINEARARLQSARELQNFETQIADIEQLNSSGDYAEAISRVAVMREQGIDDSRFTQLEAAANRGIEEQTSRKEQQARQLAAQQRAQAEQRKRLAEANRRQQKRREDYESHLSDAEGSLSSGDIDAARLWLDRARSLQISSQRLTNLESRVVAQENFQRKPLSEYEVSFATGQFNALKLAVESKNQSTIASLSEGSPSKLQLFDRLFNDYTRLDAKIVDINQALDPKRVTAILRIERMIRSNGDIGIPAPGWQDHELRLHRERYGWSRIIW